MSISACTIMKNEFQNLPSYVNKLQRYVEEIVLVDNGSTDNSAELARSLGCVVLSSDNEFDKARNRYIETAKSEWLLTIDIDEEMLPQHLLLLKKALKKLDSDVYGVSIPCIQYFGERKWATWYTPRIIRNSKELGYSSPIHGSITRSIAGSGRKLGYIPALLHHFDGVISCERNLAKRQRNIGLLEKETKVNPTRASAYFQLAKEFYAIGEVNKALELTNTALRLDTDHHTYIMLEYAQILTDLGLYQQAYHYANKQMETYHKLIKEGVPRAQRHIREVDLCRVVLSRCLWETGEKERAIEILLENIQENPDLPHNYLSVYNCNPAKFQSYFAAAVQRNPLILDSRVSQPEKKYNIYSFLSCVF